VKYVQLFRVSFGAPPNFPQQALQHFNTAPISRQSTIIYLIQGASIFSAYLGPGSIW